MSSPNPRIVQTIAFITGFVIMVVELVGAKALNPYFGSSIAVWGSVITVFMTALATGYYVGGRYSLKAPSLPKLSAILSLAGLFVLLLPWLSKPIMRETFLLIEDSRYGSLIAATILFGPAIVLMGMVSPYCVRLLTLQSDTSGHTAGTLYFISTIGSALGTILTSFYFVLYVELNDIYLCAAAVLLAIGLVGLVCKARCKT